VPAVAKTTGLGGVPLASWIIEKYLLNWTREERKAPAIEPITGINSVYPVVGRNK